MLLIQAAAQAVSSPTVAHPLAGTIVELLWLLPLLPFLGFVINGALAMVPVYHAGPEDPSHDPEAGHTDVAHEEEYDRQTVRFHTRFNFISSILGPAVIAVSFVLALLMFFAMRGAGDMSRPFVQTYANWMPAGGLQIDWSFQLDQLSMVMVLVITGVGTLIHIFSIGYMRTDPGYSRFFAYLNLFVFFMLTLVLGANYPVLFVGWEGVGLCSYLLIGFWFGDQANANAGKKAFIVNRIGDFGFLIAIFLLWTNLSAVDFQGVNQAVSSLPAGGALITTICLFLFLGCAGKSAQLPLYIWLPDAMAGPTPVSALIHAATMVTAGVYLIARSAALFSLAPIACLIVAITGALTALFAATIGLKQWDIKKVLAYSTVSQLGYMFIAAGIGAYSASVFHLVTHAFFKALLFLGAGSVIHALHEAYHHSGRHEDAQDMRNMGGLRKFMPITGVLMWIATLAISGVPPFSGFFSKDQILESVFVRAHGSPLAEAHLLGIPGSVILYGIYVIGLLTALLTAVYMTRMMLYTFEGQNRTGEQERHYLHEAPWIMTGPLVVLGVLTTIGGWLNLPPALPLGPIEGLDHWLDPVVSASAARLAGAESHIAPSLEWTLIAIAVLVALLGIIGAYLTLKPTVLPDKAHAPASTGVGRVLEGAYGIDALVDRVLVRPTVSLSRRLLWRGIDVGVIDGLFINGSAYLARGFAWVGSRVQNGDTGGYAWILVAGVVILLAAFTF
jgi:NADH-quinone oxidoreductase subunit L